MEQYIYWFIKKSTKININIDDQHETLGNSMEKYLLKIAQLYLDRYEWGLNCRDLPFFALVA